MISYRSLLYSMELRSVWVHVLETSKVNISLCQVASHKSWNITILCTYAIVSLQLSFKVIYALLKYLVLQFFAGENDIALQITST